MSAPPKTVLSTTPEEEAAIRDAVRHADPFSIGRMIAGPEHVESLAELLSHPAVSGPIIDLPRPFTPATMAVWIADFAARQARGEGILLVTSDFGGKTVVSYSQITIWPERASAELAGAVSADLQGLGGGFDGAIKTFGWMFAVLGIRLIGLAAAADNIRSARLIDRAGFERMGERDSIRADGTIRRSLYWEMSRARWDSLARERDEPAS